MRGDRLVETETTEISVGELLAEMEKAGQSGESLGDELMSRSKLALVAKNNNSKSGSL